MPTVKPRNNDRTRSFSDEVQIAETSSGLRRDTRNIDYEFNGGARKFRSKDKKFGEGS